nr:transposase [Solobacterium sp.]
EHPSGQVSAEYIMVVCEDCGHIESVPELSMYVPEDGYDPENDPDYHGYLMGYEFAEHYTLVKTYRHTCGHCGGKMKRPDPGQKEFRCPVCGEVLEEEGLMWD